MTDARQSNINVSHFDRMVQRIDEAYDYYKAQGRPLGNIFLVPIRAGGKSPDTLRVYDRNEDGTFGSVAAGARLTPDEARRRIENGSNVGIITISEEDKLKIYSLVFLDFDVKNGKTLAPEEKIVQYIREKNHFAYRTRSGGYRIVAINDGRFENSKFIYGGEFVPEDQRIEAGDILANRKYTVAPGSFAPTDANSTPDATGYYSLYNDAPIRVLDNADLPDWFEFGNVELTETQKQTIRTLKINFDSDPTENKHWKTKGGLSVDDARGMDEQLDDLLEGADHTGKSGSRSEADFYTMAKLLFYGFDEQQTAEIIRFYRPYAKTMRPDYLLHSIAKLAGAPDRDHYKSHEERAKEPLVIIPDMPVYEVDRLPDPKDLPLDKLISIINGPPRWGKSRWGLTVIADRESGIYVAPNHTIIDQQFESLSKIAPHLTSVHLAGKDRCCTQTNEEGVRMDCMHCALFPQQIRSSSEDYSDVLTTHSYEDFAHRALANLRHLTTENVAVNYSYACPYYLLHYAEKESDVCFTVPQYVASEDELTHVTPRAVMVLDEDTTFKYFVPSSVELLEFAKYTGSVMVKSNMPSIMDTLEPLIEYIAEKERKPAWDRVIMEIIDVYKNLLTIFDDFVESKGGDASAAAAKQGVLDRIQSVDMIYLKDTDREMKERVLEKLQEYERDLHIHSENGLLPIFEPMLFPYADAMFSWNGDNPSKLFLVGDQEQIIRRPCGSDQYILIGFTEAEIFAKTFIKDLMDRSPHLLKDIVPEKKKIVRNPDIDLWKTARAHTELVEQRRLIKGVKPREETPPPRLAPSSGFQTDLDFIGVYENLSAKYRLTSFPYTENFTVFRIVGTVREQDRILFKLIRLMVEWNKEGDWASPGLVLTSSKDAQERLWSGLGESGETHMCRIESIDRIRQLSMMGILALFYQNSTISRGVDVPQFDLMFVHSTSFAQPYWSARLDFYRDLMIDFSIALGRKTPKDLNSEHGSKISELKSKKSKEELETGLREARAQYYETEKIQRSLLSDETTNGSLRMSPIPGDRSKHRKVMVVRDRDFKLINPMITAGMQVINIGNATDLNLVVTAMTKISKSTNPNAIMSEFDCSAPFSSDPTMGVLVPCTISKPLSNYVSDGLSITDGLVELEILLAGSPEFKPPEEEKIERIMEDMYKHVLVFAGSWLAEKKVIKMAQSRKKYRRTADAAAALKRLVQSKLVLVKETDGIRKYKATGEPFVAPKPEVREKVLISARADGDPEW
jgi:hypothetical protein